MNANDRKVRLGTILTLAAFVAVHSFCIRAPLFLMDDAQEFAFVNGLDSVWSLFGCDAFNLFRPVKNILFAAFSLLRVRDDLFFCRMLALAIGIASYFAVLGLMRRLFRREAPAVLATAIWLLAPTQVSSVAWLSAVNIQVMCIFAALALSAHLDDRPARAALFAFLAMVSYESAVALLPLFFALDLFLRRVRLKSVRGWLPLAIYAAAGVAYLGLRGAIGGAAQVNGSFSGTTRIDLVAAAAHFTLQHFSVWSFPFGHLAVAGSYRLGEVPCWGLALDWLLLASLALVALLALNRRPLFGLGLAVGLVAFVPTSNLFGLGNGPWGDYYLGLSSMGFSLALTDACLGLWSARARCGRIAAALAAIGLGSRLAAVPEAARWAAVWGDGLLALAQTEVTFPKSYMATIMLAQKACDLGCWELALRSAAKAEAAAGPESDVPATADMIRGLVALNGERNAEKALALLERSGRSPRIAPARRRMCLFYQGCVYEDLLNDVRRAGQMYAAALEGKWTSDSVPAADRQARLLALSGDVRSAIRLWERALSLDPASRSVAHNLKQARAQLE